ncbi:polyisoprenoid-binding protein [Vulcanimicrobium alpinum]|uniref:Polyisoprenoid-binding protein n=1 Tax=Vulcanimicrobium alpinum TaxID=3016050 RepID=A0AAN2C9L7_UNVUL|nr:YceI family protein [Vulcanimicrobium alpinum]BDE05742.1 polyisoprenoid-binding protein [Vulcanimicrobium alpinum]
MIRRFLAAAAVVAALGAPCVAYAAEYTLDPNHTQAEFTVVHLAISQVRGQIPVTSGTMEIGPGDLPSAISATLSAKDLDTHSADRDKELRGDDWFAIERYPTITFVAKKIEGTAQAFTVSGDLTMHGVTKPVTLSGKMLGKMTDGRNRAHLGYVAATTVDRRDWGLNWGKTTPGGALIAAYDVAINLNVEAVAR